MKYEELNKAIDLLVEGGFVKKIKPIWDNDIYEIMNKINKGYGMEESLNDLTNTLDMCLNESAYNVDLPKDGIPRMVLDGLQPIIDYDDDNNAYIEEDSFCEFIEDLKEDDPELLDEIKLSLGDSFDKLYNGEITTITFLDDEEPSM
jgi:hypothetical protein